MSSPLKIQTWTTHFDHFWTWLQSDDSQNIFRLLTVITSHQNIPNARTMVLRDVIDNRFIFFTDRRSHKIQEIQSNPQTCIHHYDRESKIQFLFKGLLRPLLSHPKMPIWKQMAMQRFHDYGANCPPSTYINDISEIDYSEQEASENFWVLAFSAQIVEIVQLAPPKHLRFQWIFDNSTNRWKQHQMVP